MVLLGSVGRRFLLAWSLAGPAIILLPTFAAGGPAFYPAIIRPTNRTADTSSSPRPLILSMVLTISSIIISSELSLMKKLGTNQSI